MIPARRPRTRPQRRRAWAALAVVAALAAPAAAPAQGFGQREADFAPGFGLVLGQGETADGGAGRTLGFTSRRLKDNERIGSLALMAAEYEGGIPFRALSAAVAEDDVHLRVQSVHAELRRYFPLGGNILYYWALRGGYTRLEGEVTTADGRTHRVERDQVAPLALLAVPLALENPAFLMLAFLDGTSLGLTVDVIAERLWFDLGVGAQVLPRFRDNRIVVEEPFLLTRTLQMVLVF